MNIINSNIIKVNNLSVSYGFNQNPVLNNLKLKIKKNEHIAIIGASGCGKSTFAKTIVQMLPKGAISLGDLNINGEDPRLLNKDQLQLFRRKTFGFIYQDSIRKLNPLMTIRDHLFEIYKLHYKDKFSNTYLENIVKETFNKVGIDSIRLNSFPHEFSGGMRQRVCIAMAMALKPSILIADEPTTSLDSYTSYQIMNQILLLCKRFGSTLILISHDINMAAKWCKRVAIIDKGIIVEKGDMREFLNSQKTSFGKNLVKSINTSINSNFSSKKDHELILEVVNLRYWYRSNSSIFKSEWNKALNEVSFKLFRGETLGVVGISGSGKSTLGRVLIGLINKRGGYINKHFSTFKNNKDLKIKKAREIQMIFQDPFSSLNPKMSIKSILEDVYKTHYQSNFLDMNNDLKITLSKLNLPSNNSFLNSFPNQLSGGQLQRISIARALLIKPRILICDESLNMLDASVKIEILQLLRNIQNEMNLSIIFITHDLSLAQKFCNRLIVMDKGSIVENGDSLKIFKNPQHVVTKTLIKNSLNIN